MPYTMEQLDKKYISLFKKLEKLDDNENSHILQDKIYRKFIKDICKNEFTTLKDIKKVANSINKNVVKHDKGRWYA
jgi:hypothetical protein